MPCWHSGETELEVRFGLEDGVGGGFPNGVTEASFQRLCSVLQRSCDDGQLTPISGYGCWGACVRPRARAQGDWWACSDHAGLARRRGLAPDALLGSCSARAPDLVLPALCCRPPLARLQRLANDARPVLHVATTRHAQPARRARCRAQALAAARRHGASVRACARARTPAWTSLPTSSATPPCPSARTLSHTRTHTPQGMFVVQRGVYGCVCMWPKSPSSPNRVKGNIPSIPSIKSHTGVC